MELIFIKKQIFRQFLATLRDGHMATLHTVENKNKNHYFGDT